MVEGRPKRSWRTKGEKSEATSGLAFRFSIDGVNWLAARESLTSFTFVHRHTISSSYDESASIAYNQSAYMHA